MSFDNLSDRFLKDAAVFGPSALDEHIERLAKLIKAGKGPTRKEGETLLKQLRGERCFKAMLSVASLLGNNLSAMGRIYQAQALIEQENDDRLNLVRDNLKQIQQDLQAGKLDRDFHGIPTQQKEARRKIRSETLGLLGRLYKQEFVSAHARGEKDEAAQHLRDSMFYHQQGFELNEAWHGANLVALAWRADQENIALGRLKKAAVIAVELENKLSPAESLSPWKLAALAQAKMALGRWDEGLTLYRRYLQTLQTFAGAGAAFILMGDLRQLQEIWKIDQEGEGPRLSILHELSQRILTHPDGSVELTSDTLQSFTTEADSPSFNTSYQPEAIFDDDRNMYLYSVLEDLSCQAKAICRVRDRSANLRQKGGTGFLVHGEAIGASHNGPVLVTAAHVLATEEVYEAGTLVANEAEVFFETWKESEADCTFSIGKCIWESPPHAYDVSVWHVKDLPQDAQVVDVYQKANPYPRPNNNTNQYFGTVVPIGHPGGRSLTWTLGSNEVLDHDLHRDQGSPRVVHYKANTEGGSSGCPVFDRSGKVVSIHRAFTRNPIPGSPKNYSDGYSANEGIGIYSAARACRSSRNI
ncbi:MAG: trypsin-like peptidase domain-containing protein [Bacteroidota bacterium]